MAKTFLPVSGRKEKECPSKSTAASRVPEIPPGSPAIPGPGRTEAPPGMPKTRSPVHNGLLAALPPADYERLAGHLEPMPLPAGFAFPQRAATAGHVCFITSGIVAHSMVLESG